MWHAFWLYVYYNSQTIQAAAAVLAFGGLILYAFDTRKIRIATLAQSEASRRPYFQAQEYKFEQDEDKKAFGNKYYYQFRNVGSGIALNVRWRFMNETQKPMVLLGSCAVNQVKYLFNADKDWTDYDQIFAGGGVYLEFEDTAGARYWSNITFVPMIDGDIHVMVNTGKV